MPRIAAARIASFIAGTPAAMARCGSLLKLAGWLCSALTDMARSISWILLVGEDCLPSVRGLRPWRPALAQYLCGMIRRLLYSRLAVCFRRTRGVQLTLCISAQLLY